MAQLTLQQLREFGLSPDTCYGQHFLVDDNILRVIGRLARLAEDDVVYEPGAGVGVLTDFLAGRVAKVYSIELDRRLKRALEHVCSDHTNIELVWGDAMQVDVAALRPAPGKLVSNLPYSIAAPIIAEALQRFPFLRSFCVMVQREIAGRMFAPVGSPGYGALSVLVQATCTRTGVHKVSRTVFVPPPNVDSQLLAFDRDRTLLGDDEVAPFSSFARTAFAYRRKTLANNLGPPREHVVAALRAVGHGAAARAQELDADAFVAVWRELADCPRLCASSDHGGAR